MKKAKTYINAREYWEELQIKAVYTWRYNEWLDSKIAWLYNVNPEYAEKLHAGEARPPQKWSWEVWYKNELDKEEEYYKELDKKQLSQTNATGSHSS